MPGEQAVHRKNFRIHLLEGALYISSGALHSAQTLYPALILRLGGNNLAIGALHLVIYLAFFLPQIISAHYVTRFEYRLPWVLKAGLLQRMQILLMAVSIGVFGNSYPTTALFLVFLIYTTNQIIAGVTSPAWFDLLAKTIGTTDRGKLIGLRTSLGAMVGFLNGLLLTALLTLISFPLNYAAAVGVAFLYQASSLVVQRRLVESRASVLKEPAPLSLLWTRVRQIVHHDPVFKRFLVASSFMTVGLSPISFFTVAALRKFDLNESFVGLFTILSLGAQVASGALLGWLADRRGTKVSLLVSGASLLAATGLALMSQSMLYYHAVFIFVGVNVGAEMMTRYNFAVECSSEEDRPMYVGLMNAWFAPFYLSGLACGWLSDLYGYDAVFAGSLLFSATGLFLLSRVPDPRRAKLALSSK